IDVKANVGDPLLRRLQGLGVTILDANAAYGSLRLEANLDQIELIAAFPEVIFVSPKQLAMTSVGSKTSEGDVTHRAGSARTTFFADGSGVKIGVLSDGVTELAASQALGDLGPVTVLPGQWGSGNEGTAMLEIIHDLAPGAQLYFATAFNGITSFAQNIK